MREYGNDAKHQDRKELNKMTDREKAYNNYCKAHGFSPSEGWDDGYYSEDFSENWQKYVKEE